MSSVLIASTQAGGTSGDITATAGVPVTIFMALAATETTFPPDAKAVIEFKSNGGQYFAVPGGELNASNPLAVIDGPGTYRVRLFPAGTALTVEQG